MDNTLTSLTYTAYYTRAAIKYGIILIIALIVGRILWTIGTNVYLSLFPPPPPPPTVKFGKLPALAFPEKPVPTLTLTLQTPTGEVPQLSSQALVYFMPQSTSTLLALDEATKIATNMGFAGQKQALSEAVYRFERERTPLTLDINIVNKTFSVNYDLAQSPELLQIRPRSTTDAANAVAYFLNSGGLYAKDLEEGLKTFEFLKVQEGNLIRANSLSEAQFIKVNLFRKNYSSGSTDPEDKGLPVLTPDRKTGNVWFIVTGDTTRDKEIIGGEYHYFPINEKEASTYPLKTAAVAWSELISGKGHIAQLPTNNETSVTVRRVFLAYYDSGRPQDFLQPIIVFEGDNNFSAYVPAISQEYYDDGNEATPSAQPLEPTSQ